MANIPSPERGRKIVERENMWGQKEYLNRPDSGCWVATAYYKDPLHPEVEFLRSKRAEFLTSNTWGQITHWVNTIYFAIGRSAFGKWWATGASADTGFRRAISKHILNFLKWFAQR